MNGWNLVQGVNTWVVSLLKYSAAFIKWKKCEFLAVDGKTRNLLTIYGGFHQKSDCDRLYTHRKDGRRGLIAIEDCVELPVRCLEVYVYGSEQRLRQAASGDRVDGLEAASALKKAKKKKRLQYWEEEALNRQYLRRTKEVSS